jgi:hypothetical protein
MLFYVLSEFVLFSEFGSAENIEFVQEFLRKSDHSQQETRQEGKKHNFE